MKIEYLLLGIWIMVLSFLVHIESMKDYSLGALTGVGLFLVFISFFEGEKGK